MIDGKYEVDANGLINSIPDLQDAVHKLAATLARLVLTSEVENLLGAAATNLAGEMCVAIHDLVCMNRSAEHVLEDTPEVATWNDLPETPRC